MNRLAVRLPMPTPGSVLPRTRARREAALAVLSSARRERRLSQRDLSHALGRAHSFIAKVEGGQRHLTLLEFWEIADVLELDPAGLFAAAVESVRGLHS